MLGILHLQAFEEQFLLKLGKRKELKALTLLSRDARLIPKLGTVLDKLHTDPVRSLGLSSVTVTSGKCNFPHRGGKCDVVLMLRGSGGRHVAHSWLHPIAGGTRLSGWMAFLWQGWLRVRKWDGDGGVVRIGGWVEL